MKISKLVCLDFETTGIDVQTCGVVQAAICMAGPQANALAWAARYSEIYHPGIPIPPESTSVHGISDADVVGKSSFAIAAEATASHVEKMETALVTFNGRNFDVPVFERYLGRELTCPHIDVAHLWQHLRALGATAPHDKDLPASVMSGSLAACHRHQTGRTFDGAHDALVDVEATLRALAEMMRTLGWDAAKCVELSSTPLPGFVDLDSKFKWTGTRAAIAFGKHSGTLLRDLPHSYLRWMVKSDFSAETKAIAANALKGRFPTC